MLSFPLFRTCTSTPSTPPLPPKIVSRAGLPTFVQLIT